MKVYLAKSNRSNPLDLILVRSELKNYDVEILEFKGGQYTHADVKRSDCLIAIPESNKYPIMIGKGLYEQINESENPYLVISGSNSDIKIIKIEKSKLQRISWVAEDYVNYAQYLGNFHMNEKISAILPSKETEILL